MKFFGDKKKNTDSDVLISTDTKDFRYIVPKDYPVPSFGDVCRDSDADFIKKGNHDDRTPGFRDPLIDAHTEVNKRVIQDHLSANLRMWQVIKAGVQAQRQRVMSDLAFIETINSILNMGDNSDDENKKS